MSVRHFVTCLWLGIVVAERPSLEIQQGRIQGVDLTTRLGRQIAGYMSIPFAEPPVDALRFKAPVPVKPWKGVLDCSQDSPKCPQRNPYIREKEIVGVEDCLYLNVYTPRMPSEEGPLLPVMVFFHGGGWMCGGASHDHYGPEYLLDRDVVFVATNYRLGPLGFLSTQDSNCPGNNGLKDQQEALRWIQRNIGYFGGDNSSVTIFGESAGGASAHFHMLSPTSAGLFHKAISESGTAMVPWAWAPPGEALKQAMRLARLLSCPVAPSDKLLECLRTKDSFDIINTEFNFYQWDYEPMTPFKAVLEPEAPGAFITQDPRLKPDVPAVPWMTGLTKNEGCLKTVWLMKNDSLYEEFSTGFDSIAPVTFYYENSPDVEGVTSSLRHFYLNGNLGLLEQSDFAGITDIYTDAYFAYPALEAIKLTLSYSKLPIYLYEIMYEGTNSFSQIFGDPDGKHGVCHADDLMYLFPISFLTKPWSEQDTDMINVFVTLWTNFATSGNPNLPIKVLDTEWKPVSNYETLEKLDIDAKSSMSRDFANRARIWDQLPLWQMYKLRRTFKDEL